MKDLMLLALLPLAACSTPSKLCDTAAFRRSVYTTAIAAANVYIASGRPLPDGLLLGREAHVMALTVLNTNCPVSSTAM